VKFISTAATDSSDLSKIKIDISKNRKEIGKWFLLFTFAINQFFDILLVCNYFIFKQEDKIQILLFLFTEE